MNFKPLQNLAEQAAQYLGERIIHLELKPGERIVEKKVADELGVSQAPIREALRILEKRKLVELIPRKGAKVAEFSPSMIEWLYDVIGELLCLVARRCIENGDEHDFRRVKKALRGIEKAVAERNIMDYVEAIRDFAFSSVNATKNPFLENMIMDLWPATIRIQFAALKMGTSNLERSRDLFRLSYQALEENQPAKAAEAIRKLVEEEKIHSLNMLHHFGK